MRAVTLRLGERYPVVQPGSNGSVEAFQLATYPSLVYFQVVSASSDGTLKAWNPHDTASNPTLVGSHSDYVRCLAYWYPFINLRIHLILLTPFVYSCDQNWVASGSFDKSIKLWDLNRASPTGSDPLITLKSPDGAGSKSSVYAIAVDPAGSVIASGTPERVIRTWDPRSGRRTAKLVGHTDNIRAILISADGKYASRSCFHWETQLISAISY